jgi:hypothetical protein
VKRTWSASLWLFAREDKKLLPCLFLGEQFVCPTSVVRFRYFALLLGMFFGFLRLTSTRRCKMREKKSGIQLRTQTAEEKKSSSSGPSSLLPPPPLPSLLSALSPPLLFRRYRLLRRGTCSYRSKTSSSNSIFCVVKPLIWRSLSQIKDVDP